jgi:hypothetical protein
MGSPGLASMATHLSASMKYRELEYAVSQCTGKWVWTFHPPKVDGLFRQVVFGDSLSQIEANSAAEAAIDRLLDSN